MGLIDETSKTARAVQFQTEQTLKRQSKAEAERLKKKNYKLSLNKYFWDAFRNCENIDNQLQDFYKIDTRLKVIEALTKEVDDIRELNALYDAELQRIYKIFNNQEKSTKQKELTAYQVEQLKIARERLEFQRQKEAERLRKQEQKEADSIQYKKQKEAIRNAAEAKQSFCNVLILLILAPIMILAGFIDAAAKSK